MGNLGQKTKAGFYKKVGRDVLRFDLESKDYVPGGEKADEVYGRMLKKPAAQRLKLLREASGAQGRFLWSILRNSFHYAAVHLATIAETARDVDQAMRWGFGMKQGPFELWQEAGWLQVALLVAYASAGFLLQSAGESVEAKLRIFAALHICGFVFRLFSACALWLQPDFETETLVGRPLGISLGSAGKVVSLSASPVPSAFIT